MKKITLFLTIITALATLNSNAQNYGMKSTGTFGDGFSSSQIGALLSSQSAFTIEFWYKIDSFVANTWIFRMEVSPTNRIGLLTAGSDNGTVFARVGNGTTHGQQPFLNTGLTAGTVWNHVALTFNAGTVKLYINGILKTGGVITGAYPGSTGDLSATPFQMAWSTAANIDEVRITKGTALSTINTAKSSTPANFDAYFDFNANERPIGAATSNTVTANIGSNATVLGQINNFGTTTQNSDNPTLRVRSFDKTNNLQIYPNPASDQVNILLPSNSSGKVSIYDVSGKLILQKIVADQNEVNINTSNLTTGIYTVSFENQTIKKVSKLVIR